MLGSIANESLTDYPLISHYYDFGLLYDGTENFLFLKNSSRTHVSTIISQELGL